MLGKLIKYEFKATYRFMLLMYVVLFALSVILGSGISLNIDEFVYRISENFEVGAKIFKVLAVLIIMLFVIMNAVVLSGMFFYSIKRFKDNMLGGEGYLMHTLPVKTGNNILAKNIVSVIWTVISCIAVVVSYLIMLTVIEGSEVFERIFDKLFNIDWSRLYESGFIITFCETALLGFVTVIKSYFHIYASMSIGYSSNVHRAAKSVAAYIILNIAASVTQTVILSPFSDTGRGIFIGIPENINIFLVGQIVVTAVTAAIFYFVTNYFMSKKLNLQ